MECDLNGGYCFMAIYCFNKHFYDDYDYDKDDHDDDGDDGRRQTEEEVRMNE